MFGEELCRIVRRHRREGPVTEKDVFWYEAVVAEPAGERVIAQSHEWLHETHGLVELEDPETVRRRNVQHDADSRAELASALIADCWEPSAFNDRGLPTTFRRTRGVSPSESKLDVATLLRELDDLRQAGLLTAEEFEVKKAELLRRTQQVSL